MSVNINRPLWKQFEEEGTSSQNKVCDARRNEKKKGNQWINLNKHWPHKRVIQTVYYLRWFNLMIFQFYRGCMCNIHSVETVIRILSLVIVLEAMKGAGVDYGESQHCLDRYYLKGGHYWITPWAGVEGLLLSAKKTWQVEGLDVSIFTEICLHSICLHSHVQDSIPSQPPNECPSLYQRTFCKVKNSICIVIQSQNETRFGY